MPTASNNLFPGGFSPDGSGSGNDSASLVSEVSAATQTSNTPKAKQLKLRFLGTTDEHWLFSKQLPPNYASGGTLRGVLKFLTATSGTAVVKAGQVTSVNSSTDDDALVFAAAAVSSAISAPATQGQTVEFSIALTTTNMAASRKIIIFIGRDTDHASDTITTELELLSLALEYTT